MNVKTYFILCKALLIAQIVVGQGNNSSIEILKKCSGDNWDLPNFDCGSACFDPLTERTKCLLFGALCIPGSYLPFNYMCSTASIVDIIAVNALCNTDCICVHGAKSGSCQKDTLKDFQYCHCEYGGPVGEPCPVEVSNPLCDVFNLHCDFDCGCFHNSKGECRDNNNGKQYCKCIYSQ